MTLLGLTLLIMTFWGLAYGSARAIVWIITPPVLLVALNLAGLVTPLGSLLVILPYAAALFFYL
ncbi:MAG: hypothetical protein AB2689_27005, partial [Candidatus Thiodiazotropha taylori]